MQAADDVTAALRAVFSTDESVPRGTCDVTAASDAADVAAALAQVLYRQTGAVSRPALIAGNELSDTATGPSSCGVGWAPLREPV